MQYQLSAGLAWPHISCPRWQETIVARELRVFRYDDEEEEEEVPGVWRDELCVMASTFIGFMSRLLCGTLAEDFEDSADARIVARDNLHENLVNPRNVILRNEPFRPVAGVKMNTLADLPRCARSANNFLKLMAIKATDSHVL